MKTGTGWVKPDDGWLVLDRNGDESIDSGRELFGADTLKSNEQLATDGFDALKDLDANSDGMIDLADSIFANLRIWRDLNQDGISQADELAALSAYSITAIGVGSTAVRTDMGNGNVQTAAGTFICSNQTTGTMGETCGSAANLDLLVNTFYRQFTDQVTLTNQAKALPNLCGSGRVRDLSEAISLSTELGDWMQLYTQQTTRQGQISMLDGCIEKWANTADLQPLKAQADALSAHGVVLNYRLAGLTAGTPAYDDFIRKLGVVERFMGFTYGGVNGQARFTPLDAGSGYLPVLLAAEQIANISLAYDRFKTDIYESLLLETRLGRYFDQIDIVMANGQVVLDFQPLENAFKQAIADNPRDGVIDLIEFLSAAGETRIKNLQWNAIGFLTTQLNNVPELGAFGEELSRWTVRLAASTEHNLSGTSRPDLLVGTVADDTLNGGNGADMLAGGAGNDTLKGGLDNDTYPFGIGAGQDTIYDYDTTAGNVDTVQMAGRLPEEVTLNRRISGIQVTNDLLLSLNGTTDTLTVANHFSGSSHKIERVAFDNGTLWSAADLDGAAAVPITSGNLYATSGNDVIDLRNPVASTLSGPGGAALNAGNDTYLFAAGAGQDVICDFDSSAGNIDTVRMVGLLPSGVVLSRSINGATVGNDLVMTISGATDSLTVRDHYWGASYTKIEQILFDDGTVWGTAELNAVPLLPTTAGNFYATSGDDVIDLRSPVASVIYGPNNSYSSNSGNDTYLFGAGAGQDRIVDGAFQVGDSIDIVRVIGALPSDVSFRHGISGDAIGSDLEITINGTTDTLTVQSFFSSDIYKIERISFDDGTTWNVADISAHLSPVLPTTATLQATSGDDLIDLRHAASTSVSMAWNLNNTGNDTYLFGTGAGQDAITDCDTTAGNSDTIQLTGLLPSAITLGRAISGSSATNNLTIAIHGTTDMLTVKDYFSGSANKIEKLLFDDGTAWSTTELDGARILPTTAGTLYLSDGVDVVDLRNPVATAIAGSSNRGNDTYLFAPGAGQDTITDNDTTAGNTDTIRMIGILPAQLTLGRRVQGNSATSDLLISLNGTTDSLAVAGYFSGNSGKIERVEFDDGTVWGTAQLDTAQALLSTGPTLYATSGSDMIDLRNPVSTIVTGPNGLTFNTGNDTYLFGIGAGQDTINDYDSTAGNIDTVQVIGLLPSAVTLTRSISGTNAGSGLVVQINGTTDAVTVGGHFPSGPLQIERVVFDNGTVWGAAEFNAAPYLPTTSTFYATSGSDLVDLRSGVSTSVSGPYGNSPNSGNDTYLFAAGAGQDKIKDDDTTAGNSDTIRIMGITPAEITLSRAISGSYLDDALVLAIHGTTDTLTVLSYFNGSANKIERVLFDDGTVWNAAVLDAAPATPTTGVLYSRSGSDVIDLRNGVATTVSGSSNAGNDTYLFGVGAGQDTINDYDTTAGNLDTVRMIGRLPSEVTLSRVSNNLVMTLNGTPDRLTVQNYFSGSAYKIERVQFDNGSVWGAFQLDNLNVNHAPTVANPVPDQTTVEDVPLTFSVNANTFADGDPGDALIFSASLANGDPLPAWLAYDAVTRTFSGTPGRDDVGAALIRVTAVDAGGLSVADIFELVVLNANTPPVVALPMVDQMVIEDLFFSFAVPDNTFVDADVGDTLTCTATLADGTPWPSWLLFDAESRTFHGTPTSTASGLLNVRLTVTDREGTPASDEFVLEIANHVLGTAAANALSGTAQRDVMEGLEGNDTLNGGAGADTLIGGPGNDTCVVDNVGDGVIENAGEGTDTVQSSVSHALGANVENLTLTGTAAINGMGNTLNNILTGNGAANTLSGGTGNDTLNGGGGADTLIGHLGNDVYVVDNAGDGVVESADEGTDTVQSHLDYTLGSDLENLTLVGSTAIRGTGNALHNMLTGNAAANTLSGGVGNDTLNGAAGADILIGGEGDDTYTVDNAGDTLLELADEGLDLVNSSVSYTLSANLERITLTGSAAVEGIGNGLDNLLTGNAAANILSGGAGNDTLNGAAGADTLIGGAGDDAYAVDNIDDRVVEVAGEGVDTVSASVNHTLADAVENLTLTGSAALRATGNELDNLLVGNAAANTLDGAAGSDTLTGGAGNDTYIVDNVGDTVVEMTGQGTDSVQSSVSYTLGANVEHLILVGNAAIDGTGNDLNNRLTGNVAVNILSGGAGNDTLNGGGGADTLIGRLGNDIYVVDEAGVVIIEEAGEGTDTVQSTVSRTLAAHLENLTLMGMEAVDGVGNELNNILTGNDASNTLSGGAGNDTLKGGAGIDTLIGGLGNDLYVIDPLDDVVIEHAGEGSDTVQSAVSYTLGANLENLTLTGTAAIDGTGNDLNNVLTGNVAANMLSGGMGNDTLNGGAGADTLTGRLGNDIYIIDNAGDWVVEMAGEGSDTVRSYLDYALGNDVENLTLVGSSVIHGTGNALNNLLTGNAAANTLTGGAGNDTLNGAAGADTLIGGEGDDTYGVDQADDAILELADEGLDLVNSSVSYTLSAHLERLTLTGAVAVEGTGNALDNLLTGNAAANMLTGGAGNDTLNGAVGADTLIGGAGNDAYMVDNIDDRIVEAAGEGVDAVSASVGYRLADHVENLTLTGSTAINATGNDLDNLLTGNAAANLLSGGAGNDTLDGGRGADTLMGGVGNDSYIVDNSGDSVVEHANEGVDRVQSSITWTLAENVDDLTLIGAGNIHGTGNPLDNQLTGTTGNNTLTGHAGNDTLDGRAGSDMLVGGAGDDAYILGRGYGSDTVRENDVTAGNTDMAQFLTDIDADQLWLRHLGNNLEVSVIGTADRLTLENWYLGTPYHVEQFRTADNKRLLDNQVESLVQAMAAFAPPVVGQMTLPQNYRDALAPVIAANWQ
ncbi:MAG: putative Ig domain-containing protein [Magnetococcus sp. MYC-9]